MVTADYLDAGRLTAVLVTPRLVPNAAAGASRRVDDTAGLARIARMPTLVAVPA